MNEDVSRKPATRTTVERWIAKYACTYDVVADPEVTLSPGGSIGMPYNVVIDPRTMKVEKVISGDGEKVDVVVEALVARNTGRP